MTIDIKKRQLYFFGTGAVAKTTIYYLNQFFLIDPKKITFFDLINYSSSPEIEHYLKLGSKFIVTDLNKTYKKYINQLKSFDIIIDLTAGTESVAFIEQCRIKNIHYINTSIESKDSTKQEYKKYLAKNLHTYLNAHNDITNLSNKYSKNKATICVEMGANPGLISCFTKLSILHLAKSIKNKSTLLTELIKNKYYNKICRELEIERLECSETDSSQFDDKHKPKILNNTWSVAGMLSELSAYSEFTWGSHELEMPDKATMIYDNIINLNTPSFNCYSESYVPDDGIMIGVNIPHGEGISLSSYLKDGDYSPTSHYVYSYSPIAYESLKLIPKSKYGDNPKANFCHVVNNYEDDFTGIDRIGCLLVTKNKTSIWCGSILSNDDTKLYSGTLIQVMVGVLCGLSWILENPDKGLIFPEVIDEDYIMKLGGKYLNVFCNFVPYKPKSNQYTDLQKTEIEFNKYFKNKYKV